MNNLSWQFVKVKTIVRSCNSKETTPLNKSGFSDPKNSTKIKIIRSNTWTNFNIHQLKAGSQVKSRNWWQNGEKWQKMLLFVYIFLSICWVVDFEMLLVSDLLTEFTFPYFPWKHLASNMIFVNIGVPVQRVHRNRMLWLKLCGFATRQNVLHSNGNVCVSVCQFYSSFLLLYMLFPLKVN